MPISSSLTGIVLPQIPYRSVSRSYHLRIKLIFENQATYPKFYHTFVHNHLQRLIRIMGMHYNGVGWEMLRRHLKDLIPADHALYKAWLDPSSSVVDGKCLMRMRLQGSYRDVSQPFRIRRNRSNSLADGVFAIPQFDSVQGHKLDHCNRLI